MPPHIVRLGMLDSFFLVKERKEEHTNTILFSLASIGHAESLRPGPSMRPREPRSHRITRRDCHSPRSASRERERETPGPRCIWRKPAAMARRIGARGPARLVSRERGGRRSQTMAARAHRLPVGRPLPAPDKSTGPRHMPHITSPPPPLPTSKLGKPNGQAP